MARWDREVMAIFAFFSMYFCIFLVFYIKHLFIYYVIFLKKNEWETNMRKIIVDLIFPFPWNFFIATF